MHDTHLSRSSPNEGLASCEKSLTNPPRTEGFFMERKEPKINWKQKYREFLNLHPELPKQRPKTQRKARKAYKLAMGTREPLDFIYENRDRLKDPRNGNTSFEYFQFWCTLHDQEGPSNSFAGLNDFTIVFQGKISYSTNRAPTQKSNKV